MLFIRRAHADDRSSVHHHVSDREMYVCEPVRGRFVVGHTARQAFGLLLFQSKTTNFLLLFFGALSLA